MGKNVEKEVINISRIMNIGSIILIIVGIVGVFYGLQDILIGPINGSISSNGDKLKLTYQFAGLYMLCLSLGLCITSLFPYRKGKKWAWYTTLIVFGLALLGQLTLVYIGGNLLPEYYLPASIILVILWLVGLLLPIKEFFR